MWWAHTRLPYGFAQLLAGLLTDRVGSRRLMLAGLGLAAAGSATFAVTDNAVAVLARLLMGVAGGCLYTPTIACSPPSRMRSEAGRWASRAAGVGAGQVLALLGLPTSSR